MAWLLGDPCHWQRVSLELLNRVCEVDDRKSGPHPSAFISLQNAVQLSSREDHVAITEQGLACDFHVAVLDILGAELSLCQALEVTAVHFNSRKDCVALTEQSLACSFS